MKAAVGHLKDLKIGVMGCVVNGPGEMADADYGYVGAGRGRVSIYRGKDLIEKNIPREEALAALIAPDQGRRPLASPQVIPESEQVRYYQVLRVRC